MTISEASNINAAFLRLKDKALPFKTALLISRNVQKIETAIKPFLDTVNASSERVEKFRKEIDKSELDSVSKEKALKEFVEPLNDEIKEASKESITLETSNLEPIPESVLEKIDVTMDEIHGLVIAGLIK